MRDGRKPADIARQRFRLRLTAMAFAVLAAGCGVSHPMAGTATPSAVPVAQLPQLLATVGDVNALIGATNLMAQPPASEMNDNRHLLPNLNCLGVWQPDETAIYGEQGDDKWAAVRHQTMQDRGDDEWEHLVVQSVVAYPSEQAASAFFTESAHRWARCTDHHVNITLNDRRLPSWLSGRLNRTESRLTMPITRGDGARSRFCQHVLDVRKNLVIEVQTCTPPASGAGQAAKIADRIESFIA